MLIAPLEKQQQVENAGDMALAISKDSTAMKKHYDEDEAFAERARVTTSSNYRAVMPISVRCGVKRYHDDAKPEITYDRLNVT